MSSVRTETEPMGDPDMHLNRFDTGSGWLRPLNALATLILAVIFAFSPALAGHDPKQKTFDSPEAAVAALIAVVKAHDRNESLAILGPSAGRWLDSGDEAADREAADRFVAAYEQKHALESQGGDRSVLSVGKDDWPFPIPVTRHGGKWHFDAASGKEEILARRIGKNELAAIQVVRAIVDAQREYASIDRNGDGLHAYAGKFASTPGDYDGLYWRVSEGNIPSPLGPLVAEAAAHGYRGASGPLTPYHGYFFRILTAQGKDAPGGAYDYLVNGKLLGGFAVLAWPAKYGNSGVMSFIVNHDGTVFQNNLGPRTAEIAAGMKAYNPGKGWTKAPAN